MIASYLGKDLREKFMQKEEGTKSREEVLRSYKNKKAAVPLLEELAGVEDAVLRVAIRNLDNLTLAVALSGTSGEICVRFLSNLSDRLLYFIHEDIQAVQAEYKAVLDAQRKVLKLVKTSN